MAALQNDAPRDISIDTAAAISPIPVLGEGFSETTPSTTPRPTAQETEQPDNDSAKDPKTGKRRFWSLGKKKDDIKPSKTGETTKVTPLPMAMKAVQSPGTANPISPPHIHSYGSPSSPNRMRSSSPASSQIFERNVQEDGLVSSASPAIPSHITTENHIPPVLDASSVAITDDHLNPDNVEIVTLASHQPAALAVTGFSDNPLSPTWQDDHSPHVDNEDSASNYGSLDAADVRRLSFISFADVVHGEQGADHSSIRESILFSGATSMTSPMSARSPSPIRSPISPPISGAQSPNFRGLETSPGRGGPGSPRVGHSPPAGVELTIETMRQALRKTGSGDLSGARSQPMSATTEDAGVEHPFK